MEETRFTNRSAVIIPDTAMEVYEILKHRDVLFKDDCGITLWYRLEEGVLGYIQVDREQVREAVKENLPVYSIAVDRNVYAEPGYCEVVDNTEEALQAMVDELFSKMVGKFIITDEVTDDMEV